MPTDKVTIDILANTKKADAGMKGLMGNLAKVAGAVAALKGLQTVINSSIEANKKQVIAETKLAAILESTGNALGINQKELQDYASKLQNLTGVGDEVIINAQAQLATFTKVGKEVFPRAIEAAMDLSKAFDQDLKSSTIQIGKALQDPIQGITALRRVGVQLSKQQEEQIKKFMEFGDIASAQKIILGELETQVGGVSKAYGQTLPGKMDIVKAKFGDVQEKVGAIAVEIAMKFMPIVEKLIAWVEKAVAWFSGLSKEMKTLIAIIAGIVAGIGPAIIAVKGLSAALAFLAANPIVLVVAGLTALAVGIGAVIAKTVQTNREMKEQAVILEKTAKSVDDYKKALQEAVFLDKEVLSLERLQEGLKKIREEKDRLKKRIEFLSQEDVGKVRQYGINIRLAADNSDRHAQIIKEKEIIQDQLNKLTAQEQLATKELLELEEKLKETKKEEEKLDLKRLENVMEMNESNHIRILQQAGEEVELLKLKEEKEINAAKKIGADVTLIKEYYANEYQKITDEMVRKTHEKWNEQIESTKQKYNEILFLVGDISSKIESVVTQLFKNEELAMINRYNKEELAIKNSMKSEKEKEAAMEALEEKYAKKRASIKRKQAVAEKVFAVTKAIIDALSAATEALPSIELSIAVGALGLANAGLIAAQPIPSFAQGGNFLTSGPQIIQVGDNLSGRERVNIEPDDSKPRVMVVNIEGREFLAWIQEKIDSGDIRTKRAS